MRIVTTRFLRILGRAGVSLKGNEKIGRCEHDFSLHTRGTLAHIISQFLTRPYKSTCVLFYRFIGLLLPLNLSSFFSRKMKDSRVRSQREQLASRTEWLRFYKNPSTVDKASSRKHPVPCLDIPSYRAPRRAHVIPEGVGKRKRKGEKE